MKLNVKYVEKDGEHLKIWVKKPKNKKYKELLTEIYKNFGDNDNFLEPYLTIDNKYIVLVFILRNRDDIKLYTRNMGGVL